MSFIWLLKSKAIKEGWLVEGRLNLKEEGEDRKKEGGIPARVMKTVLGVV